MRNTLWVDVPFTYSVNTAWGPSWGMDPRISYPAGGGVAVELAALRLTVALIESLREIREGLPLFD